MPRSVNTLARGAIALLAGLVAAAPLAVPSPSSSAVAPNGKIAYVAFGPADIPFGPPEQADIWVMEPDGTGQVNLTDSPSVDDTEPAFSPDGSKIAFVSDNFTRTLTVMNADGTGTTAVVDGAYSPSWGPDGTSIAILRSRDGAPTALVIIDLATGAETVVTESAYLEPTWSPDGSKFAFVALRDEQYPDPITGEPQVGTQHEIVVVNADGSGEVVVSAGAPGSVRATELEEDRAPAWSPDGAKLAFMSQSQAGGCCGPWQLWAVNADGTGIGNLSADDTVQDQFPAWSPDGTSIVFERSDATGTNLYSIPAPAQLRQGTTIRSAPGATTGPATPLTSDGNAQDPSWGARSTAPSTAALTVNVRHGWRAGGRVVSSPTGIVCGADCTEAYAMGTRVTLKAVPRADSRFVRWLGACTSTQRTCVVTMDDARTVTAVFRRR